MAPGVKEPPLTTSGFLTISKTIHCEIDKIRTSACQGQWLIRILVNQSVDQWRLRNGRFIFCPHPVPCAVHAGWSAVCFTEQGIPLKRPRSAGNAATGGLGVELGMPLKT